MTETYAELGGQPAPLSSQGQEFLDALTAEARSRFHRTDAGRVAFTRCINRGWTPKQLAKECSRDLGTAANAGAIIQHRLEQRATLDPPKTAPKFVQPKPWCGQCSDSVARWRLDTDKAVRCDCWTTPGTV